MPVSKKVARVLRGVSELNDAERQEFIFSLIDLLSGDITKSRVIKEDMTKSLSVTFGPAPNTCPCCGR